jgi:hypothetical protein
VVLYRFEDVGGAEHTLRLWRVGLPVNCWQFWRYRLATGGLLVADGADLVLPEALHTDTAAAEVLPCLTVGVKEDLTRMRGPAPVGGVWGRRYAEPLALATMDRDDRPAGMLTPWRDRPAWFGLWHPDAWASVLDPEEALEVFATLADAVWALRKRYESNGIWTSPFHYRARPTQYLLSPCVTDGAYLDLYRSTQAEDIALRLSFGPRGGIVIDRG